jgi:hypothetical protein
MKRSLLTIVVLLALLTFAAFPGASQAALADYFDTVQKFYLGYYQRPADPAGLLFWANALSQIDTAHTGTVSREAILPMLHDFAYSDEARSLYNGDITGANIATVVDSIYQGLFARSAEPGGLAFYVNGFNSGGETPATILWSVMSGAQGTDALSVGNKVTAAGRFTQMIDPNLDGLPPFQRAYAGDDDAVKARQWLAAFTSDTSIIAERALIQTGLSIGLASNVLQSQVEVMFQSGSRSLPCTALTGGGSIKTGATPSITVEGHAIYPLTVYYDSHCTKPYIVTDVTAMVQTGEGSGTLAETAAYYGPDGNQIGTMTLNEVITETIAGNAITNIEVNGLSLFVPKGQTPVQLGLSCNIPFSFGSATMVLQCAGGVVQDFPALKLAAGAITSLTLTISHTSGGSSIAFTGTGSTTTGPIGWITLTNPSWNSFVTQNGIPFTTTAHSGSAAEFALFPPTPTGWSLTDPVNDEKLEISVVSNTTRSLSLTITTISSGSTLASGTIDQSGTGTITYSDGQSTSITNWTVAN